MWSRPRLVKPPAASLHAVEPALVEPVARGLHRRMGDAVVGEFGQQPVQRDRIGRGQRAIVVAAGRDDAGGADAGGGMAGLLPDLAREGGDRGLAAGAGDGDHGCRLRAGRSARRQRQRTARIVDARSPARRQRRQRHPWPPRSRRRPAPPHRPHKRAPSALRAGDGDEQRRPARPGANPTVTPVTSTSPARRAIGAGKMPARSLQLHRVRSSRRQSRALSGRASRIIDRRRA